MPSAPPRLIGRDAELSRLTELVDAALVGAGAGLVVRGEPGIGKSALLAAAERHARERGLRVLAARGFEAEADIPFAGLTSLFGPLLDLRGQLPDGQLAALGAPTDQPRFAVAAATAALLDLAAEAEPVAVLVDDAHWLDEESLEAILFAARRLAGDRLAFVLATRPAPALAAARLPKLELGRLGDGDAELLLRSSGALASGTRRELAAAAAGNPLALVELPRALTADQRAGVAELPRPLRAGDAIEAAFAAQLAPLAGEVRLALALLAAEPDPEPVAAALAALGLGETELAAAAIAGVVERDGGSAGFRHPLLRSAAYHGVGADERRRVHAALGDAHLANGEPTRAAWHRAAAATGPDAEVAALLDRAADEARARGAPSLAAHAARRAAELTTDPRARDERLLAAARDLARTARPERAAELAAAAVASCDDPLLRADLERVRGEVLIRLGRFEEAVDLLYAEAERVAPLDAERGARMLLSASVRYRASGDYVAMGDAARRARELAGAGAPDVALLADLVLAHVLTIGGDRAAGDALIERREPDLADPPPDATPELLVSPAHASLWAERPERAERIVDRLIAAGRERSAPAALAFPLGVRAQLRFRAGRWRAALADGEEALALATDTGQLALVAFAGGALAEVEAGSGREDDCREHAERALAIADPTGSDAIGIYARAALGLLELGLGRLEAAVDALAWCRSAAARMGMGEASVAHWPGALVEALARAGARAELATLVAELEATAAATGGAYAAGCAARGRGLLAADGWEPDLDGSIAAFEAAGLPFEAARSRLALGERLRRDRRRRAAVEPLTAAHAAFERLGAAPWAERAAAELRAAGATVAGDDQRPVGDLTAAELRVALLAADGRTNPEIAADLFVSRRTVEHQLSAVYRKLDLRSRAELATALRQ